MPPASLATLLSFSDAGQLLPSAGSSILVTDTTGSPATFFLVHCLKSALVESKPARPVIWIGCDAQGLPHLAAICRKSAGANLSQLANVGSFHFIDAAELITDSDGESGLRKLYSDVEAKLQDCQAASSSSSPSSASALIIIDDLTALAWALQTEQEDKSSVSCAARSISRWTIALRNLCSQHSASLVYRQHASINLVLDDLSSQLFNRLRRSSSLWIEIKELSSGKAKDCSGEIAVHPLLGATAEVDEIYSPAKGRSKAMLFHINNDGSTVIWARGTQGAM